AEAKRGGRRQDEGLRVMDEEPRIFGSLRPKSCMFLFSFFAFTWGLARVGGFRTLFGPKGDYFQMALTAAAAIAVRGLEQYEDPNWLPFVLRYHLSGRRRSVYTGGCPPHVDPHPLDDLLLATRLGRALGRGGRP